MAQRQAPIGTAEAHLQFAASTAAGSAAFGRQELSSLADKPAAVNVADREAGLSVELAAQGRAAMQASKTAKQSQVVASSPAEVLQTDGGQPSPAVAVATAASPLAQGWISQVSASAAEAGMATSSIAAVSNARGASELAMSFGNVPAPARAVGEGGAEPSAVSRRRFAAAAQDAEPSSQHLMLRELNDQEVLASMRDAHLGSPESQMAAQELARALMQAGYARVQVVVNGHKQRLGDATLDEGSSGNSVSSAEPDRRITSNTQPISHGN